MPLWEKYHRPQTIDDALARLREHGGRARILAGGTDLLLEMQQGHRPPVEAMVDVTAIPEMIEIRHDRQTGLIELGAAVTHTQIVKSDLITRQATCLVESCGVIGGPQVRNVATLGGNVAHALPAADGTTALVVLDAEAEIAAPSGRSWRPILSLFKGPGISTVDQTRELITRFRFPAGTRGTGTAFKRIMRPQGIALPILACAVWVKVGEHVSGNGSGEAGADVVDDVRICIGPVQPVPTRAREAEQALRGRSLQEALPDAVAAAQAEFSPRTSKHRATAEYRVEMIDVLLRRALPLAVRRARTGEAVPEGLGL
ncbi:MAG: xanthine dehydrogenase family protein subunit M [Candidatus Promineifilaceae bacterium]|nr:xanthine dehydrogenase family protein subunit M [Candidatus Promineifilaceae bacterium]